MAGETPAPFVDSKTVSAISLIARACLKKFEILHDLLQSLPLDQPGDIELDLQNTRLVVEDAQARFKAWGTNIAAFRDGNLRISLDFRLNEAPGVKSRAIRILKDLEEYLDDVTSIVVGHKTNTTWSLDNTSDSSDESEEETNRGEEKNMDETDKVEYGATSELEELLKAISASNSSLMKLSIVIRSSATRDDYIKAASRFQTWNTWPDISHVTEKYGRVKHIEKWLLERLGRAISRRRQFLKYRVEHHNKITGVNDDEEERMKPEKTIFASTKATTFVGHENIIQRIKPPGSDTGNSFGTQTSYDATVFGNDGEPAMLRVPPPPKFAFPNVEFQYGEVFQCPYCFTEQTVDNRTAWKKHVFRDLKPYVCTFKGCEMLMFRSRNEWFAHELQYHRREWVCQFCDHIPFMSVPEFAKHIKSAHTTVLASSPLQALILQGEEQVDKIASNACPLCDDWESDLKRKHSNRSTALPPLESVNGDIYRKLKMFRKHLGNQKLSSLNSRQLQMSRAWKECSHNNVLLCGRTLKTLLSGHMEQLALFALPLNQDGEELEDGSSDASAYIYINLRRQPDREDNFEHDSHSERAGVMHSDMREDDNSELHPNNPPSELDQQESQGLQISSYWSVPEQTDFPKLLSQFGTDWHGIAKHMTTKTHIMVKNYYMRKVGSDQAAEWKAIAQAADERKSRREPTDYTSQESSASQRENANNGLKLDSLDEELNSVDSNKVDDEPKMSHGSSSPASLSAHDNEPNKPLIESGGYYSTDDDVPEVARKELDEINEELKVYKLREESEIPLETRELERLKREFELKKLKEEKQKEDEYALAKAERKEAIEKYKAEKAKRLAEEEERKKEYKLRLEEDLRKSGMEEDQIAVVMNKEGAKKPSQTLESARPTYTRMSRKHLSIETLNVHRIEYELDVDPDYVLIKRWVPEDEQDILWKHTRDIREARQKRA